MSSFLVVAHAQLGHITPALAIAAGLQQRGHDVALYCAPTCADAVVEAGVRFCPPRAWEEHPATPPAGVDNLDSGPHIAARIMRHRFFGSVAAMTEDIEHYARELGVDLIVGELLMPGGGLAAERLNLPWASMVVQPLPVIDSHKPVLGDYFWSCFDNRETRAQLGLPPRPGNLLDQLSPLLHLVPATDAFVGATDDLPAQVQCVGPLSLPAAAGTREQPLDRVPASLLVTTSSRKPSDFWRTNADADRYVRAAIEGLAGEDVSVIITLSPWQDAAAFGALPDNIRIERFVPHEALMPTLRAVVTHGGWGIVGRALRHGVPLVIVPFGADQPINAERCQQLGLGIHLPLAQVTPERLRAAARAVLHDPAYRAQAQIEAERIRRLNPVQTAAERLEQLIAA